jgi:hypothetical protein
MPPFHVLLLLLLLQALIDVAAQGGCLGSALAVMELLQALVQVRWARIGRGRLSCGTGTCDCHTNLLRTTEYVSHLFLLLHVQV